jgi:hypothetical protein
MKVSVPNFSLLDISLFILEFSKIKQGLDLLSLPGTLALPGTRTGIER